MKLDFQSILNTVSQVGAATPAFKSLFDQVVGLFDAPDQETLKQSYAAARAKTDADHNTLQDELAKAAKK